MKTAQRLDTLVHIVRLYEITARSNPPDFFVDTRLSQAELLDILEALTGE